jgi:hypothetical protein
VTKKGLEFKPFSFFLQAEPFLFVMQTLNLNIYALGSASPKRPPEGVIRGGVFGRSFFVV